jgi:hypothetical protein
MEKSLDAMVASLGEAIVRSQSDGSPHYSRDLLTKICFGQTILHDIMGFEASC